MEIIEVFDDHVTTHADDLPVDLWQEYDLAYSQDIVEVGYDYVQVGDELTSELYITCVIMNGEELKTTADDKRELANYITEHLKQLSEESKITTNGGW